MGKTFQRAGSFIVGILLFFLGYSLLLPGEGVVHTGVTTALAAVLTALGIGVIAAAALPNELEVSGNQFKPLGLSLKASGGAAVFIVTLGFIFYMKDVKSDAASTPNPVETVASEDAGAGEDVTSGDATGEVAINEEELPEPDTATSAAPPPASLSQFQQPTTQMSADYFLAWTYCSTCCPEGPDYCPQVGMGEGLDALTAGAMAAQQCVLNGGHEDTCIANVQYLSADDFDF